MKKKSLHFILFLSFLIFANTLFAQGYLHSSGKTIVDGNNQVIILRGAGLGGWLLQEGYMFNTSSFANTQHKLKQKIADLVGKDEMENFYSNWRNNFVTRRDIDSLANWGFNSIRLPMHYNLFKSCFSENANNDEGFRIIDNLISWCKPNGMYIILDLHAAPGGQGNDLAISDGDETYTKLWNSTANQDTMVQIWQNIAKKYATETTIGGYDLLNETNWTMTNNQQLKALYIRTISAIRLYDANHLIFLEGNWFANDFTGLTPPWDNNMAYSFHKYWAPTDDASLNWIYDIMNTYNVPMWLGETGENSNAWFTAAVKVAENHKIGWANWPFKGYDKINSPVKIPITDGWERLLNYWTKGAAMPTKEQAIGYLRQMTDNLLLQNCHINIDVIDAWTRQLNTTETKPYTKFVIPGVIFCTDYDMGMPGIAYSDKVYQTTSNSNYTTWNTGWAYRNDGVDIEANVPSIPYTNGYHVAWIEDGEWMQYTANVSQTAAYKVDFVVASGGAIPGAIHLEIDGINITGSIPIPVTGSWQTWQSVMAQNVVLKQGINKIRLVIDQGNFNLSNFRFYDPQDISAITSKFINASSSINGTSISVSCNKTIASSPAPTTGDFAVNINSSPVSISNIKLDPAKTNNIIIELLQPIHFGDIVTVAYTGIALKTYDNGAIAAINNLPVSNNLPFRFILPAKIEAEYFALNSGFQFEVCTDQNAGQNAGYTDIGDYLDYLIIVPADGTYYFQYRLATPDPSAALEAKLIKDGVSTSLHSVFMPNTFGWQTWQTIIKSANLIKGEYTLRISVTNPRFNFNYVNISTLTGINDASESNFSVYPNPSKGNISISMPANMQKAKIEILDIQAKVVYSNQLENNELDKININVSDLENGIYLLKLSNDKKVYNQKISIYK